MICRHCGTEIADNALICYRCGAATTDPVRKAAAIGRRRNPIVTLVTLLILVLAALFLGQAGQIAGRAVPEWARIAGVVLLGFIAVVVAVRMIRRR